LGLLALTGVGALLAGVQLWAGYHYHEARRALERYRLAEARAHLDRCLRVWSSRFEVCLLAAQVARRMDDYEDAERRLARCRQLRPDAQEEVALEQTLIRAQRGGMDSVQPHLKSLVEEHHPATTLILEAMTRGYLRAYRFGDALYLITL